jgi:ribonuclease E
VIAAPVDAAPQLIAEEDAVVAEEVAEEAEPVAAVEDTAETLLKPPLKKSFRTLRFRLNRLSKKRKRLR